MQFFDSDGVRIAFVDIPASQEPGDPVLLIHGFASNLRVNWVATSESSAPTSWAIRWARASPPISR